MAKTPMDEENLKIYFRPFFVGGPLKADFNNSRHTLDTLFSALKRMKPPSEAKINWSSPAKWFIFSNDDVAV